MAACSMTCRQISRTNGQMTLQNRYYRCSVSSCRTAAERLFSEDDAIPLRPTAGYCRRIYVESSQL